MVSEGFNRAFSGASVRRAGSKTIPGVPEEFAGVSGGFRCLEGNHESSKRFQMYFKAFRRVTGGIVEFQGLSWGSREVQELSRKPQRSFRRL